jgi:asparagine synthase (glutamine-hydrolysing)
MHRFWDVPVDQGLRLPSDRDYEETLLELFSQAVRTRIPESTVAAELSGGLDSSSVVSMLARHGARATTLSYLDEDAADYRYFTAVEHHYGLPALHLPLGNCPFTAPGQTGGAAPAWWEPRYLAVAENLRCLGASTFLTGQLGDFAMGNFLDDSDQVAACVRRWQWRSAVREAYAWSQTLQVPIYPILWRALRLAGSLWTPPMTAELTPVSLAAPDFGDSLAEPFRRRIAPPDRRRELSWCHAPPEKRRRFRALSGILQSRALQTPEPLLPFAYTHPFSDRRLIEFVMTIPSAVLCRPGEPRRLMRRAFVGLLPEIVRQRRSKAGYAAAFRAALMPMAAEMLHDSRRLCLVEMGFADPASLCNRLTRYVQGLECNETQLRHMILFEFWLRDRFDRSPGECG